MEKSRRYQIPEKKNKINMDNKKRMQNSRQKQTPEERKKAILKVKKECRVD